MTIKYDKLLSDLREDDLTRLGDGIDSIFVKVGSSSTQNGINLLAAYAKAKALTPNGAALSATNRVCVIIPPGKYDLDGANVDAPAPGNITITPDAVGSNPVTWYYRYGWGSIDFSIRSTLSNEGSFVIGDNTTEIIVDGDTMPSWAEGFTIILGTTTGIYLTIYTLGGALYPGDINGFTPDQGMGDLLSMVEAVPIHQVFSPLTLDTEFVDIVGLTTDKSLQHIYGTPPATNSGVIVQTANDVHISNLTIEILTVYGTPHEDETDSAAYFPLGNSNNTICDNVYFKGNSGGNDVLYSIRLIFEYSGIYSNCEGGVGMFILALGKFNNCNCGIDSFEGQVSGVLKFCCAEMSEIAVLSASVATIELISGGTGYAEDDVLEVVGGIGSAATLKVNHITDGVIDGVEVLTVGAYTAEPANAVSVIGGTGNNDATFNLTWHEGHIYGCIDSTGFIAERNWDD
jgi:hypothetical protein